MFQSHVRTVPWDAYKAICWWETSQARIQPIVGRNSKFSVLLGRDSFGQNCTGQQFNWYDFISTSRICQICTIWLERRLYSVPVHFRLLEGKTDRRFSSRLSSILRYCRAFGREIMVHMLIKLSIVSLFSTGRLELWQPTFEFSTYEKGNNISLSGWQVGSLPLHSQTVVDLTHAMGESAITWPSNEPFTVTKVAIY